MNEQLISLMKKEGLTSYALAAKSGLPYTTIYRLAAGTLSTNKISAESLQRIAYVLNTSSENLLNCFEIMDNVRGSHRKIRYTWEKAHNDDLYVRFVHNGNMVLIRIGSNLTDPAYRKYYDAFAEMNIDDYIEEKAFQKELSKWIQEEENGGKRGE